MFSHPNPMSTMKTQTVPARPRTRRNIHERILSPKQVEMWTEYKTCPLGFSSGTTLGYVFTWLEGSHVLLVHSDLKLSMTYK